MSDRELLVQTRAVASREKAATLELLEHLLELERRDLVFKEGYASIWEYVHRGLGYSEAGASDRVAAMRLMKRAPEAVQMLREEKLTLTVAARVQHYVRAVEMAHKTEQVEATEIALVSPRAPTHAAIDMSALLNEVAGKSKREVERFLFPKILKRLYPVNESGS